MQEGPPVWEVFFFISHCLESGKTDEEISIKWIHNIFDTLIQIMPLWI